MMNISVFRSTENKKIYTFINHYHWKGIDFHVHTKDWKKSETKLIASNFLIVPQRQKECPNQVILLMITNSKKGIIS